jgi:hypothetical protein
MKGILHWFLTAACCLFFNFYATAQFEVLDHMGQPVIAKHYVDVKGSPYLSDEWQEGMVKLHNGNIYHGVKLKYNQIDQELTFRNQKGEAQLFVQPVVEFELNKRLFRKGYPAIDGTSSPNTFYEVLEDGPTQLLKRTSKKIIEETPYSSATKVKSVVESHSLYIANKEGRLNKIKKDKKSLLGVLPEKSSELEKYVKDSRLDLRQEADMAKLVAYYNSL